MTSLEVRELCPCDKGLPDYCPVHHPLDVTPKEMNEIAAEIQKRCKRLRVLSEALDTRRAGGKPIPGTTLFSISRWIGKRAPGEAQVIATVRIPLGFDAHAAWQTWNREKGEKDFPRWRVDTFENVELVTMPGMVIPVRREAE